MNCVCCNFVTENAALLNRHLRLCPNYDEWYKNYKPVYLKCNKCFKEFIDDKYLKIHSEKCN